MKELKKLFSVYYENLNVSSKIQYKNESIVIGKDLSKENNLLDWDWISDRCNKALNINEANNGQSISDFI